MGKEYKENAEPDLFSETSEQSRARTRAIRILGNRQLSSREMEKRLLARGESEETAMDTVKWLEDIGAVNDSEYAAAIVSHYTSKGYGVARIRDELFKRGIPRDMWDETLQKLDDVESEEAMLRFLDKKLRGSSDKEELRRATDALRRRGFDYEDARSAVARYLESIENTED